jgi:hypothetical protein
MISDATSSDAVVRQRQERAMPYTFTAHVINASTFHFKK